MKRRRKVHATRTVSDFGAAMEAIAPTALAQDWDNVGLLAGDSTATVRRVLFAIDLTRAVAAEAVRLRADLLFCYHPPIFRPIKTLVAQGSGMEPLVLECLRNDIALYASHTALDAATGGTNDVIASYCGISETQPLEFVDAPAVRGFKVVVFVPHERTDDVAQAAFAAGGGKIGDYTQCSYRGVGVGTFFGTESTNPAVGKRGRLERADETRVEIIVPQSDLPAVVAAMRGAHPYEEPAIDIYPLSPSPTHGIGRVGILPKTTTLAGLGRTLAGATGAKNASIVGPMTARIRRAIIVVGAGGSLPFRAGIGPGDVVITGEIRHHDALAIERAGATAIALGHWTSERPVLTSLVRRLKPALPGVLLKLSRADHEPLARLSQ